MRRIEELKKQISELQLELDDLQEKEVANFLKKQELSIMKIKQFVDEQKLNTKTRQREVVYKRIYLVHYLKQNKFLNLSKIGEIFDKNHATIIHYLKEYDFIKDYMDFKIYAKEIKKELLDEIQ